MKKSKIIMVAVCLVLAVSAIMLCGCEKKNDAYKGKECIICGKQASHTISGSNKPENANSKNSEVVTSGVYRIYYCDGCYDSVPKMELSPN